VNLSKYVRKSNDAKQLEKIKEMGDGDAGGGTCSADFRTVTIGTQTWMAENLNCNVKNSRCYDNDPSNCVKYGRLYDWTTAMNLPSNCNSNSCSSQIQSKHRGICPSGWHIPRDAEWEALITTVGGISTAGRKLKAASGWDNRGNGASGNGTDEYGFSALPGGIGTSYGSFYDVGFHGNWWSATESIDEDSVLGIAMYSGEERTRDGGGPKRGLNSVRCLKD